MGEGQGEGVGKVAVGESNKESLLQATEPERLLNPVRANHYSGGAGGGG